MSLVRCGTALGLSAAPELMFFFTQIRFCHSLWTWLSGTVLSTHCIRPACLAKGITG